MKKLRMRIPVPQKPPKVIIPKKVYDRKKSKKELKDEVNARS